MAKGVLGIVICPMNDDQLLYSLEKDKDIDRLVLLDNEYSKMFREKLESKKIGYELLDEVSFLSGGLNADPERYTVVIRMNDLGLHADPKHLRSYLEDEIREMQPFVDSFAVYYGLCGNYGWDLQKWAEDSGLKPVTVFKGSDGKVCDDCVAIAVGSSSRYLELEKTYTGMFYLTPAIADNWYDFVMAGGGAGSGQPTIEEQLKRTPKEVLDAFGITDTMSYMRWLFEIGNYTNVLKLYTGLSDRAAFDAKAEEIGKILNLKPIEIGPGWVTLDPADALYNRAKGCLAA